MGACLTFCAVSHYSALQQVTMFHWLWIISHTYSIWHKKKEKGHAAMWHRPPASIWQKNHVIDMSVTQNISVTQQSHFRYQHRGAAYWVCWCESCLLAQLHMCSVIGGRADRPTVILKTPATPVHPGTLCLFTTVTAAMAAKRRCRGNSLFLWQGLQ